MDLDSHSLVQPNWLNRFMIGPLLLMQGQVQDVVKSMQYYLTLAGYLIVWYMAAFYRNLTTMAYGAMCWDGLKLSYNVAYSVCPSMVHTQSPSVSPLVYHRDLY